TRPAVQICLSRTLRPAAAGFRRVRCRGNADRRDYWRTRPRKPAACCSSCDSHHAMPCRSCRLSNFRTNPERPSLDAGSIQASIGCGTKGVPVLCRGVPRRSATSGHARILPTSSTVPPPVSATLAALLFVPRAGFRDGHALLVGPDRAEEDPCRPISKIYVCRQTAPRAICLERSRKEQNCDLCRMPADLVLPR